jgi:hypothetical protein
MDGTVIVGLLLFVPLGCVTTNTLMFWFMRYSGAVVLLRPTFGVLGGIPQQPQQ